MCLYAQVNKLEIGSGVFCFSKLGGRVCVSIYPSEVFTVKSQEYMMVYCSRREQHCPFSYRTHKHITVAAGVDSLGSCVFLNISYCELFITDTDVM